MAHDKADPFLLHLQLLAERASDALDRQPPPLARRPGDRLTTAERRDALARVERRRDW